MAVQSINTLQNSDNYNNIAKEYILESLANLGQRYNVKGDSISIDSLSLTKLFRLTDADNASDYVVVIEKANDEYKIYLVDYTESLTQPILTEQTISSSTGFVEFPDFYLSNNPSIQYSRVNFLVSDLYYSFYGRADGNTALNKSYWFTERYARNSDMLIDGIRIFKSHFSGELGNKYLLVKASLNSNYNYDISLYFSKLNISETSDADMYNLVKNIDLNNTNEINTAFDYASTYECEYNSFRIIPSEEMLNQFANSNDQDILENQILYSFTDDLKNLYPYCKEQYSLTEYGDVESIYAKILIKLFDEIVATDGNTNKVFIPLLDKEGHPYSITYTYNTNKPEEIYFAGRELEVRYVSERITNAWMKLNINDYRGTVIAHTEKCDKVTFFYFESRLNNGEVIDIDVKKISTLPYIDDNGYWVINDVNTGIRAKGRDAGNPNIIIVETTKTGDRYEILAGAKREEVLEQLPWTISIAKVEPLEKINLDNLSFKNEFDYFQVECAIPDVSQIPEVNRDDFMEFLDNSIIICISPTSCILTDSTSSTDNINYTREDILEIYGEYGVVTTIWTITDGKFDYLRKQENDYAAADFNYISNINNLIQYAVKNVEPLHPDNFEFTHLVFDPTTATLKNNEKEFRTYLYPNLINKLSAQYNISNYNNDLNFTLKYNDTVIRSANGRNIENITQSGDIRYFKVNNSGNSANIVTNALYSYYDSGLPGKYNEFVPNYNVPSLDLSEVLTRNETLLNRLNILSLSSVGTSYLSYIGSSVDTEKNILTIGTSNVDVNMGTDTMINSSDRSSFAKQDVINIDFPETNINGNSNVKENLSVGTDIFLNGAVWSKDYNKIRTSTEVSDITYYTTIYTPVSRYIYELNDKYSTKHAYGCINILPEDVVKLYEDGVISSTDKDENDILLSGLCTSSIYNFSYTKNKLYVITSIAEYYNTKNVKIEGDSIEITHIPSSHMIYYSDGIYFPALLNQIGLGEFVLENDTNIITNSINLTSNMEIISVNSNPLVLLSSSTNLYPDKYIYDSNGEVVTNFTYSVFTCNPLKITYYSQGSKLNIHIEELYGKNKYSINKKIRHNYNI